MADKAYEFCDVVLDTSMEGVIDVSSDKSSGVVKKIITEGTGEIVPDGASVDVHYVGTIPSTGKVFDSSRTRGDYFTFNLGQGRVIKAWDQAVATMKVGEKAVITCQPSFAYGEAGSPPTIPPNSILNFEVEVFNFKEDISSMSSQKKIENATQLKDEAATLFSQKKYLDVLKLYEDALDYVRDFWDSNEDMTKQGVELEATLNNNQATVYRILKNWSASKKAADRAVELSSKNGKFILSQAIANTHLKNFEAAESQFEYLRTLNQFNERAQKSESKLFKMKKMYEAREKSRFKNIFSRMQTLEESEKKVAETTEATETTEDSDK